MGFVEGKAIPKIDGASSSGAFSGSGVDDCEFYSEGFGIARLAQLNGVDCEPWSMRGIELVASKSALSDHGIQLPSHQVTLKDVDYSLHHNDAKKQPIGNLWWVWFVLPVCGCLGIHWLGYYCLGRFRSDSGRFIFPMRSICSQRDQKQQ
jgi:hypothetical protein